MQIHCHQNRLILKTKFTISYGAYNHRDQLLIELADKNNTGFGETVAIDYYGQNIDDMLALAHKAAPQITRIASDISPKAFYTKLLDLFPSNSFLRSAFETAFHDLHDHKYGPDLEVVENPQVPSSITIGMSDSVENVEEKLDQRWPVFKIKINQQDFREDIITRIVDAGRSFGIDANGAFNDMGQAQKAINYLQNQGCLYIEQLLRKTMVNEIDRLDRPQESLFLLDESITSLSDAKKYVQSYDGYVLKLTKCGGITPTLEIINYAREHGKKILAGCMTESSIGINHMLQLISYFDFADLDGAYLISNDREIIERSEKNFRFLQDDGYFS